MTEGTVKQLPSACPLDCPDHCSLTATVVGDRVTKLGGSHDNPFTAGFICAKVRSFGDRAHGPERVMRPAIRTASGWKEVSWEEALTLVADRFREIIETDGPEAILPVWYGGSNGFLTGGGADIRLWNRLGVSNCERTLCAANTSAAVKMAYGDLPSAALEDIDHSQLLLLWGMNPSVSGIHLVPLVKRLRDRGGKLVVVDPRRIPLAESADLHLQVLPGTDVPVALAMAHIAFTEGLADEVWLDAHADGWETFREAARAWTPARAAATAGVAAADIERAAHLYADAASAMVRPGWGLERSRNGTDSVRAALLLPAVFGKFGRRGGGYVMSTSSGLRAKPSAWQGTSRTRSLNLSRLGRELRERTDPPVRALFVYNCNPVATVPDQATVVAELSRKERFLVVHEQVWTDTCVIADVVLPATTFLEHRELSKAYGNYGLQWAEPVIPPVGEARSNHDVMQELGRRLGVRDPLTEDELAAAVLATIPQAPPLDTLKAARAVQFEAPVQFLAARPSSGRVQFTPVPRHRPPPIDGGLPLILISPATQTAISSTMYESERSARLRMSPEDAVVRGLVTGMKVRAWNPRGEVRAVLEVDEGLRAGVVELPKGLWRRATLNEWTSNVLIPDHVDEYGRGACYHDARVEVEALGV
jgi:anaerobic selenocysteine-containing dehydrogenase